MRGSQLAASVFGPAVDLVYPPRCPLCGEGLGAQDGLCVSCWEGLDVPGQPACKSCQRPLEQDIIADELDCGACLAKAPRHDGIYAASLYNETARQLVLKFKHGRRIAMAPMLARLMTARLPAASSERLVIPVPLHWSRLWSRGFNQSALLAREIAKATGDRLLVDALVRRRRTQALGGLGRRERAKVLRGAIEVSRASTKHVAGADVVLVDDVLTSGATTAACVDALKQGGANTVAISCFARVLD
ncbi:ComF family protein [Erythrobacter sp. HKB08]|uniref:ComF family protein n=1 Tax=Erythrobacter sp. HKB08 TaxID=2502843 RepID=UPI0010086B8F|nr:ComF family protein [Erythrobacter sp. HKB08]